MSIHMHIKKEDMPLDKNPVLHSLPCKIHSDDTANVSTYFKTRTVDADGEYLKSSFRGYPLEGKKVTVPDGYQGITFYEYKKPEAEETDRNIYATGVFKEFTYWNYDKIPSKNDAFLAALDWISIAEALHSTEDEVTQ